jgi:hypothetical protein
MDQSTSPRLLPWTTPEGKPCLLVTTGTGFLSRMADQIEEDQLDWADVILERSADILREGPVTETVLRFLIARLSEALRDAVRVAHSRGDRLPPPEDEMEPRRKPNLA